MTTAEEFAKLMDNINRDAGEHYDLEGPIGLAHNANHMMAVLFAQVFTSRPHLMDEGYWAYTFPDGSIAKVSGDGKTVQA